MSRLRPALTIFLLTIAIRGFLLSRTTKSQFLYGKLTKQGLLSEEEGINVAVALARRREFADPFFRPTGPTAHLPPAFPFVTAVVFRIFGYGYTAAAVRNGINIAGLGLLYGSFPEAAAALGLGARAGNIAGIAAALFPSFRSSEVFRGRDEWAAALLLLWLTVLIYRMSTAPDWRLRRAALFGAGWGLLLNINPSTAVVLPAHILIYLCYSGRRGVTRRVREVLLAAAVITLMVLPWIIRDYRTMGAWMFLRDDFGLELRVSNGEGAQVSQAANQKTGWYCRVHPMCSAAAVAEIRRVGEVDFNRELLRKAQSWIVAHPGHFCELTLGRFAAFWADVPFTSASISNWLTFAVRLGWFVSGWLGLSLMWRAGYRVQTLCLASVAVMYPLVYYVVQYSNRYMIAVSFAIFVPSGFAADRLYRASRRAREVCYNRTPA